MIIVSDTTPIISLIKIKHLELLKKLFKKVIIPYAVYSELTSNSAFIDEIAEVRNATFLEVLSVNNEEAVRLFSKGTGLDVGESETIVLAEELNAELILMDERKGRIIAKQMGLQITGTLGILIESYHAKLISSNDVQEYMDLLIESGVRISKTLYNNILEYVNR
jgi:hypothetical protein